MTTLMKLLALAAFLSTQSAYAGKPEEGSTTKPAPEIVKCEADNSCEMTGIDKLGG